MVERRELFSGTPREDHCETTTPDVGEAGEVQLVVDHALTAEAEQARGAGRERRRLHELAHGGPRDGEGRAAGGWAPDGSGQAATGDEQRHQALQRGGQVRDERQPESAQGGVEAGVGKVVVLGVGHDHRPRWAHPPSGAGHRLVEAGRRIQYPLAGLEIGKLDQGSVHRLQRRLEHGPPPPPTVAGTVPLVSRVGHERPVRH